MAKGKKSDAPEVKVDADDAKTTDAPIAETPGPEAAPSPEAPSAEVTPPPAPAEPWPDATPEPRKPVDPPRAKAETIAMPLDLGVGAPPEVPTPGSVEDPTFMPAPRAVPDGAPGDPGTSPGRVPPGDSRSLRRANEFALIYRDGSAVISRSGTLGTRGEWRVVEYPTTASASNAYAKECSRFVADGFSDYRD